MKTFKIVLLVAVLACVPAIVLFAADPAKPVEKPLKDMTIEELLTKLETGPNQTEAFDMFMTKFTPLVPQIDKVMVQYMHYGLQDGLLLNFAPMVRPDILVVPLGPAIMSQLNAKGIIVHGVTGDMSKSLQQYDIITSVAGAEIADTGAFYKALSTCPPDKPVEFKIIRGGKSLTLSFVVPPPPPPPTDRVPQ
jgi:hypothetical protein